MAVAIGIKVSLCLWCVGVDNDYTARDHCYIMMGGKLILH